MNNSVSIQASEYPTALKDFAKENLNLKFLCAALLALAILMLVLVLFLTKRSPTVVAIASTGEIALVETKITDLQIQAAITQYLRHRYTWDFKTISEEIAKARFFVLPELISAFDRSMHETLKYVKERKVSQRVYPKNVIVDIKQKKVIVTADRITEFDGLKAATELNTTFEFSIRGRTITNPWGVYVTKETEESLK